MSYKYDASQNQEFTLLDEGFYEVKIDSMETKTLPSGKEKVAIQFRVRDDIEQKFQNRVVFEDIWKERDSDFYNRKRLNQLMGTQGFKDGTTFANIHELCDEMKGRFLRIKVTKAHDEYYDEERNGIAFYKSTEHPAKSFDDKPKEKFEPKSEPEIGEDDLPF